MAKRIATAALAALVLAAGCKPVKPLPKTYPVSGKVVHADGTPLNGGLVQFKPQGNTTVTTSGAILADGSFALSSFIDDQKVPGAVEGPHAVTILPPQGQDQRAGKGLAFQPIELGEPLTVKPDGENNFTITLPREK
jgi:hypothetical protein